MPANSDYRFPREFRVIHARHFALVFDGGVRKTAGPLVVWGAPNQVGHCRLGLAISRRVGTAPVRNRLRRLIRESFRLMRDDLPREPHGYDVVVSARRHEPLTLQQYRTALDRAVEAVDRRWQEKSNRSTHTP